MSVLYNNYSVKAIVNEELTAQLAFRYGMALSYVVSKHISSKARILIAKDTRASSDMLEAALAAGVCSVGGSCVSIGVMPVTSITYLTTKYKMDASVMIGAAMEQANFNGLRLFSDSGETFENEIFEEIKQLAETDSKFIKPAESLQIGRISRTHTGLRDYVDYIKSKAQIKLSGLKIAIDTANGAASESVKLVFTELGADVETVCNRPDGHNINADCGMHSSENLRKFVVSHKCHFGLAFNGDGSDFVVIDERGNIAKCAERSDDAVADALNYACLRVMANN